MTARSAAALNSRALAGFPAAFAITLVSTIGGRAGLCALRTFGGTSAAFLDQAAKLGEVVPIAVADADMLSDARDELLPCLHVIHRHRLRRRQS